VADSGRAVLERLALRNAGQPLEAGGRGQGAANQALLLHASRKPEKPGRAQRLFSANG